MDPVTLKPIETPPGIPADFAAALAAASAGWYASKEVVRPSTILDEKRSATVRTVATGICRYFDGANDYIHCGDVPQVGGAGALSVFAWIKTTGSTGRRAICSQWGLSVDQRAFALWIESNQLRGIVSSNGLGTGNTKDILSASGIANNTWRHVGMVFDGGGSTLTLYVDGASANLTVSDNAAVATVFDSSDPMMIGAYDIGALSGYFVDRMFDVRVYTRALSGSEVTALYNSTRIAGGDPIGSVSTANLVRHYRLDEQATGNVDIPPAYCTAGSGVHGRMYNASFSNIVTDVTVPISYDNEVGYSQWSTAAELAANGTLVTTAGVSDFTHANWIKGAGTSAPASDTLTFSVGAGATAYAYFWQTGVVHPVSVGQCVTWEYEVRSVGGPFKFRSWVSNNSGVYPSIRTAANYTITYQAVDSDWLRVTLSSEAIGVGNVGDYLAPIIYFYSADHGGGATSASFQFRNVKMYRDIALTRQPRLTTTPANDVRNRPVEYTGEAQRIALAT
ncbi:MAG: LamG domain-containing protein, partial [Desulfurellales bacterium]